jgi:serine/threonine protein kinase
MGDLVGQSLAHFRIVDKLGEGGMGVVYKATDEKLRRTVALKVLPEALARDEDRRRRFLREARAAAAVSHPNIAAVHDVGEAHGRIFIAMELLEGETLRERLGGGAMAVPGALNIAVQIARGLAKAHQANVVHRDLKPENVIVGENDHVKLLDFGLAKLREVEVATPSALEEAETETNLTREGKLLGTPGYMSPEQARGQEVDARTDVFAFGVVLYEMVTGERPFTGETTQDVLTAVMRDTPKRASELNPLVPPEMDRLTQRCLEKLRDARYANGQELLDALIAVLPEPRALHASSERKPSSPTVSLLTPGTAVAGQGTSSPSLSRGVQPPGRRTPRVLLAALALLALLGVAGLRGATRARPAAPASAATGSAVESASPSGPASPEMRGGSLPSSDREAQRLFDEAMRSFHDGTGQAVPLLEAAVRADTNFAAAYLRLWWLVKSAQTLWPGEHVDEYHRRVLALQSQLSPRDRAFLECAEEPDLRRKNAMLDAYLARCPDDDLAWVARLDGTLATDQRAASAAPTLAPVLATYARNLQVIDWRDDEAAVVITRCLELSPESTDCLSARVKNRNTRGDCAAGETDVRRWLQLQPDSRTAPAQLAGFLAERVAPVSALREALGADPFSYGEMDEIREALISMYEGDLAEVERVAKEAFARVPQKASQWEHLNPALTLVHAYTEMGDLAAAATVASITSHVAPCGGTPALHRRPRWSPPRQGAGAWTERRRASASNPTSSKTRSSSHRLMHGRTSTPRRPKHGRRHSLRWQSSKLWASPCRSSILRTAAASSFSPIVEPMHGPGSSAMSELARPVSSTPETGSAPTSTLANSTNRQATSHPPAPTTPRSLSAGVTPSRAPSPPTRRGSTRRRSGARSETALAFAPDHGGSRRSVVDRDRVEHRREEAPRAGSDCIRSVRRPRGAP